MQKKVYFCIENQKVRNMNALSVSTFRTNMATAFNQVDNGQTVLIRRNNRYYRIMPVVIDSVIDMEPNDLTKSAILEARELAKAQVASQAVDTSSVEAMLESCGI